MDRPSLSVFTKAKLCVSHASMNGKTRRIFWFVKSAFVACDICVCLLSHESVAICWTVLATNTSAIASSCAGFTVADFNLSIRSSGSTVVPAGRCMTSGSSSSMMRAFTTVFRILVNKFRDLPFLSSTIARVVSIWMCGNKSGNHPSSRSIASSCVSPASITQEGSPSCSVQRCLWKKPRCTSVRPLGCILSSSTTIDMIRTTV
mmetsp:Transcript_43579/g.100414  ORF Transcript_43579/g.100414 Transcript_43579/m.100414 type:complete len:204 (-) Transcript_43579:2677-3288(-)